MQKPIGAEILKARILPPTPENIAIAAQAVQQGDVVGMPTETVYGLAGNALSPEALTRIFETKERPTFDPLIVHVGSHAGHLDTLEKMQLVATSSLSSSLIDKIHALMDRFWPGPLTFVLPKHPKVPDLATSGLATVALRMPKHPVAQELIRVSGCSLAAPSANRFGRISPTTPQAVADELGDRISWILDGGACEIGLESTVLGLSTEGEFVILRPGGTPPEEIESALGKHLAVHPSTHSPGLKPLGPGMLESHYAPIKPFRLLPKAVFDLNSSDLNGIYEGMDPIPPKSQIGLLLMSGDPEAAASQLGNLLKRTLVPRVLSPQGNLAEIAQNLFAEMRYLDSTSVDLILAEPCPNQQGLGHAIMDRMKRASAR